MTLKSNTSYIENASDEDVERWLDWDDRFDDMMREGSARLLQAIQDHRGELFICKHPKAGNTHRVGDKKMCKVCRKHRWELGFQKVVNEHYANKWLAEKYKARLNKGGGAPSMWPKWYRPNQAFDIADVLALVGATFGLSPAIIKGAQRNGHTVDARRVVAKILRERGWSYPRIGKALGGRDHSTVINLLNRWDHHWKTKPLIQKAILRYCSEYKVSDKHMGGGDVN